MSWARANDGWGERVLEWAKGSGGAAAPPAAGSDEHAVLLRKGGIALPNAADAVRS